MIKLRFISLTHIHEHLLKVGQSHRSQVIDLHSCRREGIKRKECVRRLWPMRRRESTVSSRLDVLEEPFHLPNYNAYSNLKLRKMVIFHVLWAQQTR